MQYRKRYRGMLGVDVYTVGKVCRCAGEKEEDLLIVTPQKMQNY